MVNIAEVDGNISENDAICSKLITIHTKVSPLQENIVEKKVELLSPFIIGMIDVSCFVV